MGLLSASLKASFIPEEMIRQSKKLNRYSIK